MTQTQPEGKNKKDRKDPHTQGGVGTERTNLALLHLERFPEDSPQGHLVTAPLGAVKRGVECALKG